MATSSTRPHRREASAKRTTPVASSAAPKKATFVKKIITEIEDDEALSLLTQVKKSSPILQEVEEKDLHDLVKIFSFIRASTDEIIFHAGEQAQFLAFIMQGQCCAVFGDSLEQMRVMDAGSLIGEIAYYDAGRRSANVLAKTDCVLAVLYYSDIHSVERDFPGMERKLQRFIGKSIVHKLSSANYEISLLSHNFEVLEGKLLSMNVDVEELLANAAADNSAVSVDPGSRRESHPSAEGSPSTSPHANSLLSVNIPDLATAQGPSAPATVERNKRTAYCSTPLYLDTVSSLSSLHAPSHVSSSTSMPAPMQPLIGANTEEVESRRKSDAFSPEKLALATSSVLVCDGVQQRRRSTASLDKSAASMGNIDAQGETGTEQEDEILETFFSSRHKDKAATPGAGGSGTIRPSSGNSPGVSAAQKHQSMSFLTKLQMQLKDMKKHVEVTKQENSALRAKIEEEKRRGESKEKRLTEDLKAANEKLSECMRRVKESEGKLSEFEARSAKQQEEAMQSFVSFREDLEKKAHAAQLHSSREIARYMEEAEAARHSEMNANKVFHETVLAYKPLESVLSKTKSDLARREFENDGLKEQLGKTVADLESKLKDIDSVQRANYSCTQELNITRHEKNALAKEIERQKSLQLNFTKTIRKYRNMFKIFACCWISKFWWASRKMSLLFSRVSGYVKDFQNIHRRLEANFFGGNEADDLDHQRSSTNLQHIDLSDECDAVVARFKSYDTLHLVENAPLFSPSTSISSASSSTSVPAPVLQTRGLCEVLLPQMDCLVELMTLFGRSVQDNERLLLHWRKMANVYCNASLQQRAESMVYEERAQMECMEVLQLARHEFSQREERYKQKIEFLRNKLAQFHAYNKGTSLAVAHSAKHLDPSQFSSSLLSLNANASLLGGVMEHPTQRSSIVLTANRHAENSTLLGKIFNREGSNSSGGGGERGARGSLTARFKQNVSALLLENPLFVSSSSSSSSTSNSTTATKPDGSSSSPASGRVLFASSSGSFSSHGPLPPHDDKVLHEGENTVAVDTFSSFPSISSSSSFKRTAAVPPVGDANTQESARKPFKAWLSCSTHNAAATEKRGKKHSDALARPRTSSSGTDGDKEAALTRAKFLPRRNHSLHTTSDRPLTTGGITTDKDAVANEARKGEGADMSFRYARHNLRVSLLLSPQEERERLASYATHQSRALRAFKHRLEKSRREALAVSHQDNT